MQCQTSANSDQQSEIASLLARVTHRILTRQKLPQSNKHCLDVLPKEVLNVSTTVNTHGEQGDA